MAESICKTYTDSQLGSTEFSPKLCHGCGRRLYGSCVRRSVSLGNIAATNGNLDNCCSENENFIKSCMFCSRANKGNMEHIYPFESLRGSPEPLSPSSDGEKAYGDKNPNFFSNNKRCRDSVSVHPSTISACFPPTRSDEEAEDSGEHFFSPSSESYLDSSDIETSSVSFRHECDSYMSLGSSPSDSPSRINNSMPRADHSVQHEKQLSPNSQNQGSFNQQTMAVLVRPEGGTQDVQHVDSCIDVLSIMKNEGKFQKRLDFENNDRIWFPPPAEDEYDDAKSNYFEYDDEDDAIGESGGVFSSSEDLSMLVGGKEKRNVEHKASFKPVIQGHFKALVSQLLKGAGINFTKENESEDWLDIISKFAWQATNFVKPDTSEGRSMDPGAFLKIKCVASGSPGQSDLIKGIVCTKNIKHKRMASQHKHPRLLLIGGSLEYQRAANQLASVNTLLEEEMNHLKIILSKIKALRPNVLLVEKSVAPYAQEYLLIKDISLVLNVKRPLLQRIARCTRASITTLDSISMARLGYCELFRLEKVSEELEVTKQVNKRPSKTLMYFQGCPRRLGCTILLKGLCRNELKKIKSVVQYAVFAAYHLFLETSFLADEGATLPKVTLNSSFSVPEKTIMHNSVVSGPNPLDNIQPQQLIDVAAVPGESPHHCKEAGELLSSAEHLHSVHIPVSIEDKTDAVISDRCLDVSTSGRAVDCSSFTNDGYKVGMSGSCDTMNSSKTRLSEPIGVEQQHPVESEMVAQQASNEYVSAEDNQDSILVSFSSRSVTKGTICERSKLLRIKFYGSFDKPLGRYLCEDLFNQASYCRSCKEPVEAHVQCYTHRRGSLTISVKCLSSQKLPGQRDGKIWMWHRCLLCAYKDGVPPATRRVLMSDAAWGLSFGKFLELSFSNHVTANRVASCGHSLQRDCLRFYGFGNVVVFFRYSQIDILSVHLPPSNLEFINSRSEQEWLRQEAIQIKIKVETLYGERVQILNNIEQKNLSLYRGTSDCENLNKHVIALKDLLVSEIHYYNGLLDQDSGYISTSVQKGIDILELNNLRHSLLVGSYVWEHRFCSLDSLLRSQGSISEASHDAALRADVGTNWSLRDVKYGSERAEDALELTKKQEFMSTDRLLPLQNAYYATNASMKNDFDIWLERQRQHMDEEIAMSEISSGSLPFVASSLSDRIDSAWTGMGRNPFESQFPHLYLDVQHVGGASQVSSVDNLPVKRLISPSRVHSFDSAMRLRERLHKMLPLPLQFSTVRSFPGSRDNRRMTADPRLTTSIERFPLSYISSASCMSEGARLLLPQLGRNNLVIAVYDDEPTSIISYALSSNEHEDWISKLNDQDGSSYANRLNREDQTAYSISSWPSFGSIDLDYIGYGSYRSENTSPRTNSLCNSSKKSPHLQVSFEDDSPNAIGKTKFSVTCYFAKQFHKLRMKCCPSKVDFIRSLSRCKKWSAQGGKSNVYFAKSMDDRFIIKQLTKTELESFEDLANDYFRYLTDSLNSGSPTCLAKVLGVYQVSVKNLKGGKETKMDLMIMENIFFKRTISRIYDLKGSSRSRYNPDTTGPNKVLLDLNFLEALRTNPIFLGSKAKRKLERAVWNDTSFLASVDVMDYSLLVGVDEERKELVLGIIDFMRQYTWDKHLETWVKASGLLGGPKNGSPTIISPKQYKRRFRKAMTTYFHTVPDQWWS